ncbi:hypothetical protein MHYP_G00066550 [Metynnis hypsauchen]
MSRVWARERAGGQGEQPAAETRRLQLERSSGGLTGHLMSSTRAVCDGCTVRLRVGTRVSGTGVVCTRGRIRIQIVRLNVTAELPSSRQAGAGQRAGRCGVVFDCLRGAEMRRRPAGREADVQPTLTPQLPLCN